MKHLRRTLITSGAMAGCLLGGYSLAPSKAPDGLTPDAADAMRRATFESRKCSGARPYNAGTVTLSLRQPFGADTRNVNSVICYVRYTSYQQAGVISYAPIHTCYRYEVARWDGWRRPLSITGPFSAGTVHYGFKVCPVR